MSLSARLQILICVCDSDPTFQVNGINAQMCQNSKIMSGWDWNFYARYIESDSNTCWAYLLSSRIIFYCNFFFEIGAKV